MNLDYANERYVRNTDPEFRSILGTQPKVLKAYRQAQSLIDSSAFKDKLSPVLSISNKTINFVTFIEGSAECMKFIRLNYQKWCDLNSELKSIKVAISEKQTKGNIS